MSITSAGSKVVKPNSNAQPLSRTCQNCFSLKIRCDRTQRQDICDRCARLGKPCVFRTARRRDHSAKRDSRIFALEQQVQDLLRSRRGSACKQEPLLEDSMFSTIESYSHDGDIIDEGLVSVEKAETLLQMYKADMMPHFPFIIIPLDENVDTLRQSKPFLLLAILTVACFHDQILQEKLCHHFEDMVSDKVLLGGRERLQLEYLQGLLVALAWNHYHSRSRHYSQYLQLAISIAIDMRLDRSAADLQPTSEECKRDLLAEESDARIWSAEEKRAVAGVFYMSSTISKLTDKMNTFPCTDSIREGCLSLRQAAEYRTDMDLCHIIDLQCIMENIDHFARVSSPERDAQSAYLKLRTELEAFRVFLCTDVSDSHLLFVQFHTTKLFLHQVAFFERNLQHSLELNLPILSEGLDSAKSFLDLFLWLPPKSEMALTNTEWLQLLFGITLAAKFAMVSKQPHVQVQTRDLRHRLNVGSIFRHSALRIGSLVSRSDDGYGHQEIFSQYEQRVRNVEKWYQRTVTAAGTDSPRSIANASEPPSSTHSRSSSTSSAGVPVAATFSHQRPMEYFSPPAAKSRQSSLAQPTPSPRAMEAFRLTPVTTYHHYSPSSRATFPNLGPVHGWESMYAIPMEHSNGVVAGAGQNYGPNTTSPMSDTTST